MPVFDAISSSDKPKKAMLKLKIVSPQKIEFEGDVQSVLVPGVLGQFEILTNHAPIISALTEGTVVYAKSDGVKSQLAVAGGFVEVQKNEVALCVELNA